ncbi:MAG: FKBP-type peptidyl-prolyl cis-trans isomerase [Bacteroidia bacterium]|jgi:FKBP-type peptidyl-prolyl cis-trans isomerase
MKNTLLYLCTALVMLGACKSDSNSASNAELKTNVDSLSYALGYYLVTQNTERGWDTLNGAVIQRAFTDFYTKGDSAMLFTIEEASTILQSYSADIQQVEMTKMYEEGVKYLEQNQTKEGVVTLPSGLQYRIIQEGTGATPFATSEVICHYTGRFIDGKIFDSSVGGEPITFKVGGVIPGWTEALQLMKEGGKYELFIPSNLAYGPRGREGIPPNSALTFEIELIKVK